MAVLVAVLVETLAAQLLLLLPLRHLW